MREVPSVPVGIDAQLRNFLSAIREIVNSNSHAVKTVNNHLATVSNQVSAAVSSVSSIQTTIDATTPPIARSVTLTASTQSFNYDITGANPSPSMATITAKPINTSGAVYYEFFLNDVSTGTPTTSNTYTYTPPASYSAMPQNITVKIREDNTFSDAVAGNTLSVFGLQPGPIGGSVFKIYYQAANSATPPATPGTTTNGATPGGWSATPVTLTGVQAQFESDGVQVAGSTTTTWSTPYLSYFKVGSLSAVSADLGTVNISSTGALTSNSKTYGSATSGIFLGYDTTAYKFDVGNNLNYLRFDGTNLLVAGKRTDGTEVFRLDQFGLDTKIKQSALNLFGASYRTPIISQGDIHFTGAAANSNYVLDNATISALAVVTGTGPTGTVAVMNKVYGWDGAGNLLPQDCYVTVVTSQTNFTLSNTLTGTGWSIRTGEFSGTASIVGNVLTFTATPTGTVCPGQYVYGEFVSPKTRILSGSGLTWIVDRVQDTGGATYVTSGIAAVAATYVYIPIRTIYYGAQRILATVTGYTETRDDTTGSAAMFLVFDALINFNHATSRVVATLSAAYSWGGTDATNFFYNTVAGFTFDTAGTIVGIDGSSGVDTLYLKLRSRVSTGTTLANTWKTTFSYIVTMNDNAARPSVLY